MKSQDYSVAHKAFDSIIEFYNQNEETFLEFENKFGVNPWFLNHFRTYFSYRNLLLEQTVLTDNRTISSSKMKLSKLNIIRRLGREIIQMILNYKRVEKLKSRYLIVSNATDTVGGVNKRFGELPFDKLYNRTLFDVKKKSSKSQFKSNNPVSSDALFLRYVLKLSFIRDWYQFHLGFKKLNKEISNLGEHSRLEGYQDIQRLFLGNKFFFYISYLRYQSFVRYFNENELKGVLLSDENSPQQKVIQYAALNQGLQVFGFQHGNIHSLHPAYNYGKYKTKPLLPTITFTWGSYFSQLLQNEGGYAPNSVMATGRIPIPNRQRRMNRKLNRKDKIVLYASQPQRDLNMRKRMFLDILKTMKKLNSGYRLVVRPHPNEKEDDFFTELSIQAGYSNFIIDRETDLTTHFEICSVLIVAFSTVGTEFVPYYKPLLVLDYLNQDLIKWIEKGVGIPIRCEQDLLNTLQKQNIPVDRVQYDAFLEEYYKVGHNVLQMINKEINAA